MTTIGGSNQVTAAEPRQQAAPPLKEHHPFNWQRALAWTAMGLIIVITVFPFYWMLRTALSTNSALAAQSGSLLPADFSWGAFKRVLGLATVEESLAQGG